MKLRRIRLEFERTETLVLRRRRQTARRSHAPTAGDGADDIEFEAEDDASSMASLGEKQDETEE